jgi:hypothetical protein
MAARDILIAEAQEKIIPDPQLQTKLGKVKRVRQGKDGKERMGVWSTILTDSLSEKSRSDTKTSELGKPLRSRQRR